MKNPKPFFLVALFLLFALPLASQTGKKAPDFSLKSNNGKTITLSELKGNVVLVNFWATWCGPCRAEMPGFEEVYKQLHSRGFEIVGVSLDRRGWQDVTPFLKNVPVTYPIVVGYQNLVEAYGNFDAIPTSFLIDKQGRIVEQHIGYMSKADLEKKIKPLL
jgi:peroxiredoxin